jgi:hypothetical protein
MPKKILSRACSSWSGEAPQQKRDDRIVARDVGMLHTAADGRTLRCGDEEEPDDGRQCAARLHHRRVREARLNLGHRDRVPAISRQLSQAVEVDRLECLGCRVGRGLATPLPM